jgi:hypothetical protein
MSDMEEDAGVPGDAGEDEFAGLPEVRAQEVLLLLSEYPAGRTGVTCMHLFP